VRERPPGDQVNTARIGPPPSARGPVEAEAAVPPCRPTSTKQRSLDSYSSGAASGDIRAVPRMAATLDGVCDGARSSDRIHERCGGHAQRLDGRGYNSPPDEAGCGLLPMRAERSFVVTAVPRDRSGPRYCAPGAAKRVRIEIRPPRSCAVGRKMRVHRVAGAGSPAITRVDRYQVSPACIETNGSFAAKVDDPTDRQ